MFMGLPSVVGSEFRAVQLYITACLRHFANMNVVGARRKHAKR